MVSQHPCSRACEWEGCCQTRSALTRPCPAPQVAILYALHNGLLQGMEVSSVNVPLRLSLYVQSLWRQHAPVLREIATTQQLTDEAKLALKHALADISAVFSS